MELFWKQIKGKKGIFFSVIIATKNLKVVLDYGNITKHVIPNLKMERMIKMIRMIRMIKMKFQIKTLL